MKLLVTYVTLVYPRPTSNIKGVVSEVLEDEEDPRARKEGICGATYIGGTGIEWICIRPVHAKQYKRKVGDNTHHRGDPVFNYTKYSDSHYCVNRWPNRKRDDQNGVPNS